MDVILDSLDQTLLDPIYSWIKHMATDLACVVESPIGPWGALRRQNSYTAGLRNEICVAIGSENIWDRQSIARQYLSLFVFAMVSSTLLFFIFGSICYYRHFEPTLKFHPKFLENQVRQEIKASMLTLLVGNLLTAPIFVAQIRGHSKLYGSPEEGPGYWYEAAQFLLFLAFSDTLMYWLHRLFHLPLLFNTMHKGHHRFIIPTPFSAYAFNPIEAYIMSLPIHAYGFILPMSKFAYIMIFLVTNIWSFLLHDSQDTFHTVHHKNVKFNFGQFLPLWDQLAGTYRDPVRSLSSNSPKSRDNARAIAKGN